MDNHKPHGLLRRLARDTEAVAVVEAALTLPALIFLILGMLEMYFYMEASRRVETAAQLTADIVTRQSYVYEPGVTAPSGSTSLGDITAATLLMLYPMPTTGTNPEIDIASILFSNPSAGNNNLSGTNSGVGTVTCTASSTGPATGEANGVTNNCHGIDWEYLVGYSGGTVTSTTEYTSYANGCTSTNSIACYCVLNQASLTDSPPYCITNQSMIYVNVHYLYADPIAFFFPIIFSAPNVVITRSAYMVPRTVNFVQMCVGAATSTCL